MKSAVYAVLKVKRNTAVLEPTGEDTSSSLRSARSVRAGGAHKRGRIKVYTVFALHPGQRVRIGLSTTRQAVVGMLCLAVPLLCAVCACIASGRIVRHFCPILTAEDTEWLKASCAITGCVMGSIVMAIVARHHILSKGPSDGTLQVVEILD